MKKKYKLSLTSSHKTTVKELDSLESAIKAIIKAIFKSANSISITKNETGDEFNVEFMNNGEPYQLSIQATTNGACDLFNQLAEICRCYDQLALVELEN
jgi:hypothetical protein